MPYLSFVFHLYSGSHVSVLRALALHIIFDLLDYMYCLPVCNLP